MTKENALNKPIPASWRALGVIAALAAVIGTAAYAEEFQKDENGEVRITEETPYVQSPKVVVDTMLEMAGVHANDFLIDLGSGDGRIIITAAKERKARGFGVDYDERLVKIANANARKAGVADRASFFEQNVFQTDLGSATVVTMYLLPEYNAKLMPRLLALRPGTRIVSHDYGIDDWEPDAKKRIAVPEKKVGFEKASDIMFWIVPAKVAGHWRSSVPGASGLIDIHLMLTQRYQHFDGTVNIGGREVPIERPFLKADYLSFRIQDGKDTLVFTGRVQNSRIAGEMRRDGKTSRWHALRTEELKG
jgi:SAM-dependent methyltransferase